MKESIFLTGYVGEAESINLKDLVAKITRVREYATEIDIFINSGGGEIYEGFAISSYLQEVNKTIKINIIGVKNVLSIATIIFLSVPKSHRFLESDCDFMIHLPSGGVIGDSQTISDYASEMEELKNELIKIYAAETGIEKSVLNDLLTRETWLTAADCIDYGLTGAVLEKIVNKSTINFNQMNKPKAKLKDRIAAIVNKGKGTPPKNEQFTTADGRILDFKELEAGQTPEAGDIAEIDGKPADGEILMASGSTWIFEKGVFVAEQVSADPEDPTNEEETDAEYIAELEAEVEEKEKEIESLKAEIESLKAAKNAAEATIKAIYDEIESEDDPETPRNVVRTTRRKVTDAPKNRSIKIKRK